MIVEGTVSRLVAADPHIPSPPRVFVKLADPAALRDVDGSHKTASGEIPIVVDDVERGRVGLKVYVRIEPGKIPAFSGPPQEPPQTQRERGQSTQQQPPQSTQQQPQGATADGQFPPVT